MRLDHSNEHNQRTQRHSTIHSPLNGSSPVANGSRHEPNGSNGGHANGHTSNSPVGKRNEEPFFGHDREEVTRILLQSLCDLGYNGAAEKLSRESGFELEIPSVAGFRAAVLRGAWDEAEVLLLGLDSAELDGGGVALGNGHASRDSWPKSEILGNSYNGLSRPGLPLAEGANTTSLRFNLRQQKYLEMLEQRDVNTALAVLRRELTPLNTDVSRLHFLSSLVMCPTAEDLRAQADWDGAQGESRSILLSDLSKSISPSVMIPEHRLATLLSSVQDEQILNCRYHNTEAQPSLYTDHECSKDDFPLNALRELKSHSDEVWHVKFSHDGSMLATAGKDGLVCVYSTARWQLKHEFREHEKGSFGAGANGSLASNDQKGVCFIAFSPNDEYLISCSFANELVVVSVRNGQRVAIVDHFDYPVTSAAWLPDSTTFVAGSQSSRRPLGLYSRRNNSATSHSSAVARNVELHSWREPSWDNTRGEQQTSWLRISDVAVSVNGMRMAAATDDCRILLYSLDRADDYCKLDEWVMEDKVTSISFSSDGEMMLVSMDRGRVAALNSETGEILRHYEGVKSDKHVIRSRFGGAAENFVISGSEDSKVHIWRRQTGLLVASLDCHHPGMVNSVAWHPTNPAIFASAGDDRRVKIWVSAAAKRRPDSVDASVGATRPLSGEGRFYPFGANQHS